MGSDETNNKRQWAVVFSDLDNIILNNYWRKYYTYKVLGWDDKSIKDYLSKKENIMKIASFNTVTVSFSASSRRNRYYEVYNRPDMLDQDVAYEGAVEGLKKLSKLYDIYILSSRKTDLEEKTLEVLKRLGFDLDIITIYFLEPNKKLYLFRKEKMKEIIKKYPTGVGICLNPSDRDIFDMFNYTPVGFTSIKDFNDFISYTVPYNIVCQSWDQLLASLNCK